jgi:hypothetical protein
VLCPLLHAKAGKAKKEAFLRRTPILLLAPNPSRFSFFVSGSGGSIRPPQTNALQSGGKADGSGSPRPTSSSMSRRARATRHGDTGRAAADGGRPGAPVLRLLPAPPQSGSSLHPRPDAATVARRGGKKCNGVKRVRAVARERTAAPGPGQRHMELFNWDMCWAARATLLFTPRSLTLLCFLAEDNRDTAELAKGVPARPGCRCRVGFPWKAKKRVGLAEDQSPEGDQRGWHCRKGWDWRPGSLWFPG